MQSIVDASWECCVHDPRNMFPTFAACTDWHALPAIVKLASCDVAIVLCYIVAAA